MYLNPERIYQHRHLTIRFSENQEVAYQCHQLGEPYYLAVDIIVLDEDEILHRYFRYFEKDVHVIHYHNFIKKFLRDPFYRKEYLVRGEAHWEDVFDLDAYYRQTSRYA